MELARPAWVAYLGVLAVMLVPVGRWSDAHGRKLLCVYVYGFGLFTLNRLVVVLDEHTDHPERSTGS
jgi:MFS family permease